MGYGENARSPGAIDETARRSVVKKIGSSSRTIDLYQKGEKGRK